MKIIRQLFCFSLTILVFLSISLLTVVQISKSVNSDKFIRKTVEDKELKTEIRDGEYEIAKSFLVNLGIDYNYHKDIDLNDVFADYIFNLVKAKQKNSNSFVKIDQALLNDAIESSPYKINYRKNYTTKLEKTLNAEFDTVYQSTRVKLLLNLGQVNNLEWILLASVVVEILVLFLLRFKYSNIIKTVLFSSIINLFVYAITHFLLMIPVYTGKFLAVYLNAFIKNLNSLVLQTTLIHLLISLLAIFALIVGLKYEKKYAKKKGIKTLDNFFDDYDVDLVLETVNENKNKDKKEKE